MRIDSSTTVTHISTPRLSRWVITREKPRPPKVDTRPPIVATYGEDWAAPFHRSRRFRAHAREALAVAFERMNARLDREETRTDG